MKKVREELTEEIKKGHKHLDTLYPLINDLIDGLNKAPARLRAEIVVAVVSTIVRFTSRSSIEAWGILEGAKRYIAYSLEEKE